jgi:hypothetical protein
MANLKIIWTTGRPFSPASIDKIGYQISSGEFNIYSGSYWANQSSSMGRGYRPATAEEIAEHWKVLHPEWTPEPGDKVIVTQDFGLWRNKRGTIVKDNGDDYWIVRRDDDGHTTNFMKQNQMILAPYEESAKPVEAPESKHGFTIGDIVIPDSDNFKGRECIVRALGSASVGVHCPLGAALGGHTLDGHCPDNTGRWYSPSSLKLVSKEEPETVSKPSTPSTPSVPIPKEGYVTIRFFTKEEFKAKDLWRVLEGQGYPKGWNIEGKMNKYLGAYLQIREVDFTSDKSLGYEGWNFKDTDYEVIHEGVEPKPETTSKPGYITVRFFTETEFKTKGKWDTPANCPKGWVQAMNGYLAQTVDIKESDIHIDRDFHYHGWLFGSNDYEVLTPGYVPKSSPKVEPKVEAKVEPKEPEMKKQRFKVGDQVTYKSKSSCDGYRYGGNDHDGYVGTITNYLSYYSENGCYGIQVTSKEGNYTMLESEFHEYDVSIPVKAKEFKQPEKKFEVGDKVTYKSHSDLRRAYRFGGGNFGGKEATVLGYLDYDSEYKCYKITVTVPSSTLNFSMLECEFYEYDGTYPGAVTLGTSAGSDLRIISAGTANTTFLDTVGLQIVQTVLKPKDDLSHYNQSPVLIHKKPTKRLVVVDAY